MAFRRKFTLRHQSPFVGNGEGIGMRPSVGSWDEHRASRIRHYYTIRRSWIRRVERERERERERRCGHSTKNERTRNDRGRIGREQNWESPSEQSTAPQTKAARCSRFPGSLGGNSKAAMAKRQDNNELNRVNDTTHEHTTGRASRERAGQRGRGDKERRGGITN